MAAVTRMTRDLHQERASLLAREAVELADTGHAERASRKLREAAALGHDNAEVQAAFLKLHSGANDSPLLDMCRRYALYHDEKAGEDAVRYLRGGDGLNLTGSVAVESLKLVLESNQATLSPAQDLIITEVARQSHDVRRYFAKELQVSVTEFFDNLYERGDGAANCLRTIVLDPSLWPSEDIRLRTEDDLFQLLLAKLMESGHDLDGRALKGIALLLVANTTRLQGFIDEESFDAILASLDIRLPADYRSQATLALTKYLEVSAEAGQTFFANFVTSRVAKQKGEDLIIAFSAAASLFPIVPAMTAPLFLTEGFLPSVLKTLNHLPKAAIVKDAFLLLLSAACIDEACRSVISKHCTPWLSHMVSNGNDTQPATAATILAKLRVSSGEKPPEQKVSHESDVRDLVHLFKDYLTRKDEKNAPDAIEGLAYASLKPEVKEELGRDVAFLKSFFRALVSHTDKPEVVIGGLSVISNLTQYAPTLSEEQKKMSQLKAYANATKVLAPNPLNDDQHVRARCVAVVDAGALPVLIHLSKYQSPSARNLIDGIMLSLANNPKTRGKIAQQGAVKLLISHLRLGGRTAPAEPAAQPAAAHALARILISVDPTHVFTSSGLPHITGAVAPLVTLLNPATAEGLSDQPRDLLPIFESLLALTNLASSHDSTAAEMIIRSAWDIVEDLLLSNNVMVRRASCELVCNLVALESGAAKFADGSRRSGQRLHILLALADVDDIATRRAAGGALAMLTEHDAAISGILEVKRGTEILLNLCEDDEEDIVHRGLVCIRNMACASGDIRIQARSALHNQGAVDTLKGCLKRSRNPAILQLGVEAVKRLIEN